ncbi:Carbonic anhydrase [Rhodococcus sp. WAY2]|nr:Carbonic anhydrase [Rhodococcus sp. WAY2]
MSILENEKAPPSAAVPGPTLGERLRRNARYDVPASLVVFLVALPLSLGIAIASDAPVMAGLIAAIVGGVVAGSIGGSPLQVSGPAAGLTVVVAELVGTFGWRATCAITVAAGFLQIIFGLSRIARAALAIAPVVVHAMLAGIGITIALQQIHVLLGGGSHSSTWANITQLPSQLASARYGEVLIGSAVIAILLLWKRVPPKFGMLPGPLVAVAVATLASLVLPLDVDRITLDGSLFDALSLPAMPQGPWLAVATGVLTVALIASVESLLSAVAVDKMHGGERTEFNRELVGQGSANMVSGLIGGLPVTGVIVRSSTNVAAGARTRASAVLHGVWILVFAALLTALVQQIPMAALAGLLIVIGIQLVKLADLRTARRTGDLWVYGVTVAGVVFLNLLEGVLLGLALAVILLLWRVIHPRMRAEPIGGSESEGSGRWRVTVEGSCSFLSMPALTGLLAKVPDGAHVTVELAVDFLDHAMFEAIDEWKRHHERSGGIVVIDALGTVDMDSVGDAPPQRGVGVASARRFAPWKSWQPRHSRRRLHAGRPAPTAGGSGRIPPAQRRAPTVAPRRPEGRPEPRFAVPHLFRFPHRAQRDHQQRSGRSLHGAQCRQSRPGGPTGRVGRSRADVRIGGTERQLRHRVRPLGVRRHESRTRAGRTARRSLPHRAGARRAVADVRAAESQGVPQWSSGGTCG